MIDWIAKVLGNVMNWIYLALNYFGVANIGVTIIIFSLLMRLILFPLTYKQQKSSKIMQYIQPELNKVAKKYKGKKDQDSMMQMNIEQQAIYKKYGTSPTGSCLPMLIQFPILFGIIKIVYNIPNYIPSVKSVYMNIAAPMVAAGKDVVGKMNTLAVELKAGSYFKDYGSTTDVISLLFRFKDDSWDKARKIFADFPEVITNIDQYVPKIRHLNDFIFGINISDSPVSHGILSPYLLIPVAAALFQWIQTRTIRQPEMPDTAAGMATYTKVMMNATPIISLFIYSTLSSGIGLYWAATAFFTVIQQVALNWHFDHIDMEKVMEKQIAKAQQKKSSGKPSMYERMMQASQETAQKAGTTPKVPNGAYVNEKKTIGNIAKISTKNMASSGSHAGETVSKSDSSGSEQTTSEKRKSASTGGSISAIANMLKDK